MSSALTIFFRSLEYNWKEDEEVVDDEKEDHHKGHSKNHHPCFMSEQATNGFDKDGDNEQSNDRDDDANIEEDSSSTFSDTSSSTTSTTKSVPISAFHIQIVSDNASSNCSQTQSNSGHQFTGQGGILLPKRRHSTPTLPNDFGPRRPRGPGYSRSSSSASLLVFQHRPPQKGPFWKQVDHYDKHHDSVLPPPSSFFRPHHHRAVGGGGSSFSACSSRLTSRWHSGDQLLPAQTKLPLIQPIRRNTSRDDILVQTMTTSSSDSHDHDVGGMSPTKLMFMHCQCSKHSLHNSDRAGILSVGGCGNARTGIVILTYDFEEGNKIIADKGDKILVQRDDEGPIESFSSNFSWVILEYLEANKNKTLRESKEGRIRSAAKTADWIVDDCLPREVLQKIIRQFSTHGNKWVSTNRSRPFTVLASGGSPTTGAWVTLQGAYHHHFATRLDQHRNLTTGSTILIERGHGHRNTFHTTQLMHSFYPNQHIDLVFWEFSLNDYTATNGTREAGVNLITLYLNQLRRYYKDELSLHVPKVIFIGLTMSSLGMTANDHLDAVEDVCTKHSDLCLAVIHVPNFFQILDWNISLLNDHFLEPDGVHPNALTQGLIGKFAFEIVTQNTHDPNMSPNKLAVPVGKQVYLPSPTQSASRLSAQVERLLFGHYPAASFVSESPCNDYSDKVPSENVSSFFLAPPSMLKPTNLEDLDIVSVGKALPTRIDRKYEIQLSSCNNSTQPNPMFNLSNFTSMRHEDPYSSGSGKGVAFAGFEIVGQEQRAKFEPLGADRIHVMIGLPNGTRREITPAEMFTVPKDSEFQYTWMDLSSVYVIFDTPTEMDYVLICRNPTLRENLPVTLVQLVLYI